MCICVASFIYNHIQYITVTSIKYFVQVIGSIANKKPTEIVYVTELSQGACCFDINGFFEPNWMQLDIHLFLASHAP
jgi:hypothetical protein